MEISNSERAKQIDELCDQFESHWHTETRIEIESLVSKSSPELREDLLRELLLLEWELRKASGESPAFSEYLARFPSHQQVVLTALARSDETIIQDNVTIDGVLVSAAESRSDQLPKSNRFRIIQPHDRGGLGEVFVAHDLELNRYVALKRVRDELTSNPHCVGRFLREAELTGRLEHPNIVPVYGLGQDEQGRPFYAMRFIDGISLKSKLEEYYSRIEKGELEKREQHIEFRKLLTHFATVCDAIDYAHRQGIIHRDIKPENVMIGTYGETQVVDWGLAKVFQRVESFSKLAQGETPSLETDPHELESTIFGNAIGTPSFMSPEQASGDIPKINPSSDIYGLGATLFVILTQKRQLSGDVVETLSRAARGEVPNARSVRRSTPRPLDAICSKAMSFEPSDRYASAAALANDIEAYLAGEAVTAWREPITVRTARWVKRHQALVTSSVAVLAAISLSLIVGVLFVSSAYRREESAKETAIRSQKNAERLQRIADDEARASQAVATLMESMFRPSKPAFVFAVDHNSPNLSVANLSVRDFFLERASRIDDSQLEPQAKARLKNTIGDVYAMLGELELAEKHLEDAYAIHKREGNELDIASSEAHLGFLRLLQGDSDASIRLLDSAYEIRSRLLGEHAEQTLAVRFLRLIPLGESKETYDDEKSEELYQHVLREQEEILRIRATQVGDDHMDIANLKMLLAASYMYDGEQAKALEFLTEAEKIYREAGQGVSLGRIVLAFIDGRYFQSGESRADQYSVALDLAKELFGNSHPAVLWLTQKSVDSLAGRDESEAILRDTLAEAKLAIGNQPRTSHLMRALASTLTSQDTPEAYQEAEELLLEAKSILQSSIGPDCWMIGPVYFDLAVLYGRSGRIEKGFHTLDQAELLFETNGIQGIGRLDCKVDLERGHLHAQAGNWDQATEAYEAGIAAYPNDHFRWFRAAGWFLLADNPNGHSAFCKRMLERFDESQDFYVLERIARSVLISSTDTSLIEAGGRLADRALQLEPNEGTIPYCQLAKALFEYRSGEYQSAIERIQGDSVLESRAKLVSITAQLIVVMSYRQLGRTEEARRLFEEITPIVESLDRQRFRTPKEINPDWHHITLLFAEVSELMAENHP